MTTTTTTSTTTYLQLVLARQHAEKILSPLRAKPIAWQGTQTLAVRNTVLQMIHVLLLLLLGSSHHTDIAWMHQILHEYERNKRAREIAIEKPAKR